MSVDIKTLRIGAHVLANGVRAQVIRIDAPKEHDMPKAVILGFKATIDGDVRYAGCLDGNGVEPIPITPELLVELGFEKSKVPTRDYEKGNEVFVINLSDNRYRFEIWTKDCNHGNIIARYLHEVESFYYHVFKKELIEE